MVESTAMYSVNSTNSGTLLMNDASRLRNRGGDKGDPPSQSHEFDSSGAKEDEGYLNPKVAEDDVSLLNYIKKSSPNSSTTSLSLEQVLVNKLEEFISSTLTTLEEYFVENDLTPVNSGGSLHQHQHLSPRDRVSNARLVYQSLTLLKGASKQKKFEILDKILDEYYGNLFKNSKVSSSDEKLILGLEFIEAKLKYFLNAKSEEVLASSSDNEKRGLVSQTFRDLNIQFHNYDNAVSCGTQRLLHYWELPFPWRENKYIVYGYRFNNSYTKCAKSILNIHNETGNIWTHLVGFALVLYLSFVHFPSTQVFQKITLSGAIFMYIFLAASVKSLVSSVCWHTFNSTSNLPVRSRFACIDYTGITVLITASVITTEYCSLYYYPKARNAIIGFSTLMGFMGLYFTWSPAFDTPKARPFRIFFFVSLAAMGALSYIILGSYTGFMHGLKFYIPLSKSIGSYLLGVAFYGFLFPECCRGDVIVDEFDICDEILNELNDVDDLKDHFKVPYKTENHDSFKSLWWVDYCLSSHNIWHFFVVCGIFFHYTAVLDMFDNLEYNLPIF